MKYRASKLIVKHVDAKTEKDFLNINHKQGAITSTVAIGLFDGDELIQIETFGQPRIEIQNKSIQHQWELLRECSKKDCQVHGGKSRLLKHFIEEYKPVSILSYCSLTEGFDGHSYAACGFTKISESKSYHYEFNGQKILRYRMQKNSNLRAKGLKETIEKTLDSFGKEYDPNLTEYENAVKAGFQKINDVGNQVWEMKFTKYVGYIYEFELEGKKYRGKHIVNGRPYYGSGTAWRAWCNSIPGYKRKINVKILEWLSDDDIETLDSELTEVETKFIQEILGREDYLNISDNTRVPNYVNCHNPISNANRARTIANRTPEQRAEIAEKIQKALSGKQAELTAKRLETIAKKSSEEKEETRRKISEAHLNRSPEAKLETKNRLNKTRANWSDEFKSIIHMKKVKSLQRTREKKSPEEKEETRRKHSETCANWSDEFRKNIGKKHSETIANWSDEKRTEISEKQVMGRQKNLQKKIQKRLDFLTSYFDRVENIDQPRVKCFKGDRSISILVNGKSLEKIKEYIKLKGF